MKRIARNLLFPSLVLLSAMATAQVTDFLSSGRSQVNGGDVLAARDAALAEVRRKAIERDPGIATAQATSYTFTHFVGSAGGGSYQDGPGNTARFSFLIGVAVDPAGNVYATDSRTDVIRKISPAGFVTTLAGSLGNPGTADGFGPNARFSFPQGIAADPYGNVYVADSSNNTIRKIACDGTVSTFAGQAGVTGSADGTGSGALFNFPESLATDAGGNIYVTDSVNETIRKITPGAVVTTVAGSPGVIGSADGMGSAASFNLGQCEAIAVDSADTLYVADCGSSTIRKITPAGVVTTLAGTPGLLGSADGTGPAARFEDPEGVATDGTNVYVADGNGTIRKITPSEVVTTVAGASGTRGLADGVGAAARFDGLIQMASDGTSLFVADIFNNAVRKMAFATLAVTTLAGGSPADSGSADGTGTAASFNQPTGITTDGTDLYVTDRSNSKIRKIVTATGQVSTLVAGFDFPWGITSDGVNLYVADELNDTIRKIVIATGQVTTLAGTARVVGSADGTGGSALFNRPTGITTDGTNLYVADSSFNNTIRKIVIATAEVTTLAGTAGIVGSADGTGSAASFNRPIDITTDGTNLYVTDELNDTIRKIVIATGQVTTFAGTAGVVGSADGTGGSASFRFPLGITTDGTNLYVSDNESVRQITLSGAVVTTIGGKSGLFGATDGTGPVASFVGPRGIAVVGSNLYVADSGNNMIRRGAPAISDVAAIDSATGDRGVPRQLSTIGGQASAWSWSLITFSEGSTATFSNASIPNPIFTPDQPGFYRFRLDATGPAGRSVTTVDLSVLCSGFPTAPPVSNNGPICAGRTLQLTAGSVPGGLYCWTGPNGFASGLRNPSIPSATAAASGTYRLTVSVSGCTSQVATTTATVGPPPTAAVSGTAAICKGAAATIHAALTGTGPWNLTWSDGFTQTGVAASPATRSVAANATTTYSVTAVSNAECAGTSSGSAIIKVELPPKAAVSGGTTICAGASAVLQAALTGTPPWNLLWSDGFAQTVSTTPATRSVSPVSTTAYNVTAVSDAACAGSGSGSANVKVKPTPSSTITAPALVGAGSGNLTASVPNAGGQATYAWSITNGTITSGAGTISIKFSAGGPAGSSVTITVTVTSGGCTSTSTITIAILSFTTTGSMGTARFSHTATLLQSGKVLVTGGLGNGGFFGIFLTSSELYDPVTGMWTATGNLGAARKQHTATLLGSGKVLVAGGFKGPSALTSSEFYNPSTGKWAATGSLGAARYQHTATLLQSGKVLVTGGQDNNGNALTSAELYDPVTGKWTATGSLGAARYIHTATLLPNGKVLVAGGFNGFFYLASAELYDPGTGTWTATGSLGTPRDLHTATLLQSGKALVAGGSGRGGDLTSAELYDSGTGTWTATANLGTARNSHTATLLPRGEVLVAGGSGNGGDLSIAELYDPGMGKWTAAGSLATGRDSHTATLLPSGKVLVAGGQDNIGGYLVLSSAELCDPGTVTWTATGSLGTQRSSHTATLLANGNLLVAGGVDPSFNSMSSAELYNPGTGTWTATGSLNTARSSHTATLLPNGKVLVAGGEDEFGDGFASSELYDPVTGTWTPTGPLGTARFSHTATLLANGKLLVAGGVDPSFNSTSSAELYNPGTGMWTATGSLGTARDLHTATLLPSGKVLVTGGLGNGGFFGIFLTSSELYDPMTGAWTATGSLGTARDTHTATLLPNGKVLVAGGFNGSSGLPSSELYDPATGKWTGTGSLITARYIHTATLLPNGKVLVAGGQGNSGVLVSSELYDSGTGTWTATANLGTARNSHTATLLPSGKVLVAGGVGSGGPLTSAELYN